MTKYEFLCALRDTLTNALTPSQVEEHVQYYTRYIDEQISLGYSEAQVLSELGDPRSIAHNIIDGIEEAGKGRDGASYGEYASNTEYVNDHNTTDNDKIEKLKGYGKLAIIFLVIFAVLIAVTRLIIWALPTIFTFGVIVWSFKKLNGR